jgi:hypothetical protein
MVASWSISEEKYTLKNPFKTFKNPYTLAGFEQGSCICELHTMPQCQEPILRLPVTTQAM